MWGFFGVGGAGGSCGCCIGARCGSGVLCDYGCDSGLLVVLVSSLVAELRLRIMLIRVMVLLLKIVVVVLRLAVC